MATKVIILGQEEKQQTKKPIEFVKCIRGNGRIDDEIVEPDKPSYWDEILLLGHLHEANLDVFWVRDYDEPEADTIYLGHFNDGIV